MDGAHRYMNNRLHLWKKRFSCRKSLLIPNRMSQHLQGRSPGRPSLIEPPEHDSRKQSTVSFTATCENVWHNLRDRMEPSAAWYECPTANKPNIGYACTRHCHEKLTSLYILSDLERTPSSGTNFNSYIGICKLADVSCIHAFLRDVTVLTLDHCFATRWERSECSAKCPTVHISNR